MSNFVDVWSNKNNVLNVNFQLFSTLDDALKGENPWKFCNYNDVTSKIGFPRDCGPTRNVGGQWNSKKHGGTRKNVQYSYYSNPSKENLFLSVYNRNKSTKRFFWDSQG